MAPPGADGKRTGRFVVASICEAIHLHSMGGRPETEETRERTVALWPLSYCDRFRCRVGR